MANTLLTSTVITRKALQVLHQKCTFIGSVNRQYDDRFAQSGAKIGETLQIRKPAQYVVRNGKTLNTQDSEETKVDLTVATQKGVDMEFGAAELALDIDDFSERFIEPAMSVLAANIEADAISMYKDVYNTVDSAGSAMDVADVLKLRKRLTDSLTPTSDRRLLLSTQQMADLTDATKGLFNDQGKLAMQYREGMIGKNTLGFGEILESTITPRLAHGAANGSYDTAAAAAAGATSIAVDTGTGAAVAGQTFTIADVYEVHPETKQSTGRLQQFTLTADFAGGTGTINFSPAVYATGAKQNVDALPANNKDITFLGTASATDDQCVAYHKNAFTFATADLEVPKGVDFAARQVFDGISMRIVKDYDITNDAFPARIDVLYGYKALRPELAARGYNN